MRTVYLIACSKSKQPGPVLAENLYTGDLFVKSLAYVKHLIACGGGRLFILSAQEQLLDPFTELAAYDASLADMSASERRTWAKQTSEQLLEKLNRQTRVIFFAGKRYREHIIPRLREKGHLCNVPLEGMGIGQQKAYLKARID